MKKINKIYIHLFALCIKCFVSLPHNSKHKNTMTAQTILQQLGGSKFIAMTGAACFSDNNTLIVKFKGSQNANIMYVTLNGLDLYDVKIAKFRGTALKVVATLENAYADMLRSFFTKTTGLYTSL